MLRSPSGMAIPTNLAFDFVKHRFLLAKLKSSGIDGAVLNWIESYLSNRSYQVQIDGVISEEAPCHIGFP